MRKPLRDQELTTRPRITVIGERRPYSGLLYKVEALNARDGQKLKQEGNFPTCIYWARLWAIQNKAAYSLPLAA